MKILFFVLIFCLNLAFSQSEFTNLGVAFEEASKLSNKASFNHIKAYSHEIANRRYQIYLFANRNFGLKDSSDSSLNCVVVMRDERKNGAFCLSGLEGVSSFDLEREEHENLLLYSYANFNDELLNFYFEFAPNGTNFTLKSFLAGGEDKDLVLAETEAKMGELNSEFFAEILGQNELLAGKFFKTDIKIGQKPNSSNSENVILKTTLNHALNSFKDYEFEGAFSTNFRLLDKDYELVQFYKDEFYGQNGVYDKMKTKICAALFENSAFVGKFCYDEPRTYTLKKRPVKVVAKDEFFTIEDFGEQSQIYITFRRTKEKIYLHQYSTKTAQDTQIYYRNKGERIYLQKGLLVDLAELKNVR